MRNRTIAVCALLAFCLLGVRPSPAQQASQAPHQTVPGLASSPTAPSQKPPKALSQMDAKFLQQAAIGNIAEIQLGRMAVQRAGDPLVKQFGQRMIKDHSQADDRLQAIAASQRMALPTQLNPADQQAKERLAKENGAQFDKDYINLMVQDHKQTVAQFQREAQDSHDPTVKNLAEGTLPILQTHLQKAEQIQSQLAAGMK